MTRKPPAVPPKSVLGSIPYGKAELNAMYAWSIGAATEAQQLLAFSHVVGGLCRYHDVSFRPGEDGRRDTDFAEGRRFVGAEILKMTRVNPAILERDDA